MRKMIAVATLSLVLGVAAAAGPAEDTPEGRAYVGFSFGGTRLAPRDMHYGLRLDHDSRDYGDRASMPAPFAQVDFTRAGLADARINGLNVLKKGYRLAQNEGQPADMSSSGGDAPPPAPVEEEGFFSGMWHGVTNFFGGLFGGGDDEQPAQAAAEAAPEAAPEGELAEGTFIGYNAIDWSLLAVGAVGIGYIASEVTNGDEDQDPTASGGGGGGGSTNTCVVSPICIPLGLRNTAAGTGTRDPAYDEWLDGGTGHMGDLGG
jgi:hypothetical protein